MSTRALTLAAAMFVPASAGQVVFEAIGTTQYVVPDGVTSLCMVAVQPGGDASGIGATVTVNGVIVCRALNGARIGDGGGDGGLGGAGYATFPLLSGGGGGGAGGYTGKGGSGQSKGSQPESGQGGGGGGGGAGYINQNNPGGSGQGAGGGGGVDLKGQGTNGNSGSNYGSGGGAGSNGANGANGLTGDGPGGAGGKYGGGAGSSGWTQAGLRGGANAWKNNVSVTPGQVITVYIPAPGSNGTYLGGIGGVRILWGDGRFYPSTNTGDF